MAAKNGRALETIEEEEEAEYADALETIEEQEEAEYADALEMTEEESEAEYADAIEMTEEESEADNADAHELSKEEYEAQNADALELSEEEEEPGTFPKAGQDVLRYRAIRKANRTIQSENKSLEIMFDGSVLKMSDSSVPKPSLSSGLTNGFSSNFNSTTETKGTKQEPSSKDSAGYNPEYLFNVKILNENFISLLQKHVTENPYCIFTLSFEFYEQCVSDLEKKYCVQFPITSPQDKGKLLSPPASNATKGFHFERKEIQTVFSTDSKTLARVFTFGQSVNDASDKSAGATTGSTGGLKFFMGPPQSTVDLGSSTLSQGTGGFGAVDRAKPFSFSVWRDSSAEPAQASSSSEGEEDEESQPPKAEVQEIKQDGAVSTKRKHSPEDLVAD